jgi:23S rRNA (pseudouridine1915-N3)-methyltransferase
MRLIVAAIGRLKAGPERELADRYAGRIEKSGRAIGFRGLDIVEIRESRGQDADTRMKEETTALASAIPDGAAVVVLHESGRALDSATIARTLGGWRDAGRPATIFVIGGPDGLAPDIKRRADITLAFGAATWPHQLVRIMLLEQMYRAVTILSDHPYHRD